MRAIAVRWKLTRNERLKRKTDSVIVTEDVKRTFSVRKLRSQVLCQKWKQQSEMEAAVGWLMEGKNRNRNEMGKSDQELELKAEC